jgi:hypothetical protein
MATASQQAVYGFMVSQNPPQGGFCLRSVALRERFTIYGITRQFKKKKEGCWQRGGS